MGPTHPLGMPDNTTEDELCPYKMTMLLQINNIWSAHERIHLFQDGITYHKSTYGQPYQTFWKNQVTLCQFVSSIQILCSTIYSSYKQCLTRPIHIKSMLFFYSSDAKIYGNIWSVLIVCCIGRWAPLVCNCL